MAQCEQGYLCDVCGEEVELMTDSDLYLRYVLGEVPIFELHRTRERHIICNPAIAQFIVDPNFPPVACDGPFDKSKLRPSDANSEEMRITAAWLRLQQLPTMGLAIDEYPLQQARS